MFLYSVLCESLHEAHHAALTAVLKMHDAALCIQEVVEEGGDKFTKDVAVHQMESAVKGLAAAQADLKTVLAQLKNY